MHLATSHSSLTTRYRQAGKLLIPPQRLTVSEWADRYRMLSPESSAEPGQWDTGRAEYLRGILNAVTDATVETIVLMKASQLGFTESLLNMLAYYIDYDPSPILFVLPTLDIASAVSKDRIAPMLRDTPRLQGKVQDARTRDSGNTTLHKIFPGGHLTLSGANSPASLSSRPVRIVFCDEVDRFPMSAGTEGNPRKLAYKRTTTFWNRKHIEGSSPTIKGQSEIEASYLDSDQRKYWVPCSACHTFQTLKWGQVKWPSPSGEGRWYATEHHPELAVYLCEFCQVELDHRDKLWMVKHGEWRAEAPFKGKAGFWINELYSPWVKFSQTASAFLDAKGKGRKELQVFVNTSLAETFEEEPGEVLSETTLASRREPYGPAVPMAAALLTAAVDIQEDRIEAEVKAWGKGEESWGLEHKIFHGDTTDPKAGAWKSLDEWLQGVWLHESGISLKIVCTMIDTGYRTKECYAFIKPRQFRRVFAAKGMSERGKPLVGRPTKTNFGKVKLFPIGTDTAKETVYSRLKKTDFGPGCLHFPNTYDNEYFLQLTAEKRVTTYRKGWASIEWVKIRPRNEALDLTVLNLAALMVLNANLDRLVDDIRRQAEKADTIKSQQPSDENADPVPPSNRLTADHSSKRQHLRRAGNFVKGWK